ncbi:MAG: ATP-binding protein, partial [Lentisphaeria bacterium]
MLVSTQQSDWREVLFCGLENQQIDFKAAQDWNKIGRVGRAKFARHLMALANTLGGYLVIGVGEDPNGNPTLYTGLDEKQASSFDPSGVGQTVN